MKVDDLGLLERFSNTEVIMHLTMFRSFYQRLGIIEIFRLWRSGTVVKPEIAEDVVEVTLLAIV
jgi:hypothetical protein